MASLSMGLGDGGGVQVRPTSSLLGPLNVASVVGIWGINLVFLVGALCFMHTQTGYVKWPARYGAFTLK
jgi:cation-transporting ATPase 13A3/4/5